MYTDSKLAEYLIEIRQQVCSRCIERPPGGPPCAPLGKQCGVELHLSDMVDVVHSSKSDLIDPYIQHLHDDVCAHCANRPTDQCPCPLEYLCILAVQAIETVDERKRNSEQARPR